MRKAVMWGAVILTIGIALQYCSKPQTPKPVITTISGRVIDAIASEPVASATVSNDQNAEQVLTNDQGMYTIRVDVEVGKQYRITVTKDGYAQNTATILAREGEDRVADIPLTPSNPVLSVSPDSLRFEAVDNQKTLTVENAGGGTLSWEAMVGETWLAVEPASGRLDRGASSGVGIMVDREKVHTNRTYGSSVTFTSTKGGSKTVPVTMVVEGKEVPVLSVAPSALAFGLESDSKILTVSNPGHGVLVWRAFVSDPWLVLSPDSGAVSAGTSQFPTVTVIRERLEPGREYTGSVEILSEAAGSRSVPVTMSVPNPVIRMSARDLNFGQEHRELPLTISNIGTGTVTWTLSIPDEMSWLTAEPEEGSATLVSSASVLFSVIREGLEPGRYTGKVILTSNSTAESRIELGVVMEVVPRPELSVTPSDSLAFGMEETSLDLVITNTNNGILEWTVEGTESWISITPSEGTSTAQEEDRVTVTVTREGMSPGVHVGNVQAYSNGGNSTLRVTMEVPEPILSVSVSELDFGMETTRMTFAVKNTGTGILTWTLSEDIEWLVAAPTTGAESPGAEDSVVVRIDRSGLEPSPGYSGVLSLTSNANAVNLMVKMGVKEEPVLGVDAERLAFGTSTDTLYLHITNQGTGKVTWRISEDAGWLWLQATGGTTEKETDEIAVMVDRTDLEPGRYTTVLTVSAEKAGERTIKVDLDVARLVVSADALDFGTERNRQEVTLSRIGSGEIAWTASANTGWIGIAPSEGIIGDESVGIGITVDRTAVSPGTHTGAVRIRGDNGDELSVGITATVLEKPELWVSATELDFGRDQDQMPLVVRNVGTGVLDWSLSEEIGWLSVSRTSGAMAGGAKDTVWVNVDWSGLEIGRYTGMLQIASDGGDGTVSVSMEIPAEPVLSVSPTQLDLGTEGTEGRFTVSNSGTGVLSWTLSTDQTWLSATPKQGDTDRGASQDVVVYADRAGLAPGEYVGEIAIISNGGAGTVMVALTVPEVVPVGPFEEIVVDLPGGAAMEMVWIPPGTFMMGTLQQEIDRLNAEESDPPGWYSNEGSRHEVTITRGFYLGKYELTQGQWKSAMGTHPWKGGTYVQDKTNHPVVYISWEDVQEFIVKLNWAEGTEVYRLPTEAEWEYACRAGTTSRWSFGDDESRVGDYAWYEGNTCDVGECYGHMVGAELPNPWGLYDMHGNVWEWCQDYCQDWYASYPSEAQVDPAGPVTGSYRAVRAGRWPIGNIVR